MSRIFRGEDGSAFGRPSRLNSGLVDQHDRNLVLDPIDAVALEALQAFFVCGELYFGLAEGAGEDPEEFGVKRHGGLLNGIVAAMLPIFPATVNLRAGSMTLSVVTMEDETFQGRFRQLSPDAVLTA
jgi:hypothetical protein